ncbi:unnamed protein product, partial [Larinioides sclopetarius]
FQILTSRVLGMKSTLTFSSGEAENSLFKFRRSNCQNEDAIGGSRQSLIRLETV